MHEHLSEERRAARAIALRTRIPKRERRELLEMLGLIDSSGPHPVVKEPPPGKPKIAATVNEINADMAKSRVSAREPDMNTPLRDRSCLPEGLRNLPEPVKGKK